MFKKLLIVNLYPIGAFLLGFFLIFLMIFGAGIAQNPIISMAMIPLILLTLIVTVLVSGMLSLAIYKVVDEQHKTKKKVSVLGVAANKAISFTGYSIVTFLIFIVMILPFLALGFVLSNFSPPSMTSFEQIEAWINYLSAAIGLVALVVSFFLQFALFEMAIADKGAFESIKRSFSMVKTNFIETIIFYLLRAGIGGLISIPILIIFAIIFVIGMIAMIPLAAMSVITPFVPLIALVIGGVVMAAIFFVILVAAQAIMMPLIYQYWVGIRKKKRTAR